MLGATRRQAPWQPSGLPAVRARPRRVRAPLHASESAAAPGSDHSGANNKAVQDALRNAKRAADSAESAIDKVRRMLGQVAKRGVAAGLVGGTLAHLVTCQAAAVPLRFFTADLVTLLLVYGGYTKQALSPSGAVAAIAVGVSNTFASYAFCGLLLAFFVSSSLLTRVSSGFKKRYDAEHKKGGQRDWVQVACNGGVPSVLACLYIAATSCGHAPFLHGGSTVITALQAAVLGYYACTCGDTWASEVGIFSPGNPRLITTGETVRRGTNGAVSLLGLAFSAAGGLLMGLTGWVFAVFGHGAGTAPPHVTWIVPLGLAAGLVGSLIDSLGGATLQFSGYDHAQDLVVSAPGEGVQRIAGRNLISNNANNLLSASVTAALTAAVAVRCFCGGP